MRRIILLLLLAGLVAPTTALASAWHQYTSHAFRLSVRYPAGWHVTSTTAPGASQLVIARSGTPVYSIAVMVLPVRPGKNAKQTVANVIRYERSLGNTALAHAHWSAARLGHTAALATVMRPSTEGGVGVAQGIYVAGWHGRSYEVTTSDYSAHPPKTLAAFPAVYRQILATWKFI